MKLVIDTNILFSALIAGKTRKIIITGNQYLHAPEYTFTELKKPSKRNRENDKLDKSDYNSYSI